MEKKQSSKKHFLKKNAYYIIMVVCLLAIAAMVTVTVLINNGTINVPGQNVNEDTGTPAIKEETKTDVPENKQTAELPSEETQTDKQGEKQGEKQAEQTDKQTIIVFASPTEKINIVQNYSMDALVWNSTLKHYAVHNGIDFGGTDGDNVFCAYDGIVTNVSYDVLNGHSVTIKHNENLYTVYSSMNEPVVTVGQTVKKGGIIGTMGTTATAEYSMGAHLHFSVLENEDYVDPLTYMSYSEQK